MENERPITVNSGTNYPNASYGKLNKPQNTDLEKTRPKREPVVSKDAVQTRKPGAWKRFKHKLIDEDADQIKEYIMDVGTSTLKRTITDFVVNTVYIILYGDNRGAPTTANRGTYKYSGDVRYGNYVSYNTVSSNKLNNVGVGGRVGNSSTLRSRLSIDEFYFDTKFDAELVLNKLNDIIDACGVVSVADLYEICGKEFSHTYYNYGWTDLCNAGISETYHGYTLNLPTPCDIREM